MLTSRHTPNRGPGRPGLLWLSLTIMATGTLIAAEPSRSALESDPTGWVDIMPPADLTGWSRVPVPPGDPLGKPQWRVEEAGRLLVCEGDGGHDMLLCDREFGDALFHAEFRYTKVEGKSGYNSGIYVRNNRDGSLWHQAQIGDAFGGYLFGESPGADGQKRFFTTLNDVKDGRVKPAGEWNTIEITARGSVLTLWVNGAVTCEVTDCGNPRGLVGVEGEGFQIEFRNLKVKELPESPAAREARMQWWREARFGMFVHWGLYSGLAGTWEGNPVGTRGGMEWIQFHVKADTETYARAAIPRFKPEPDFAREWARLAREAGCAYVVFTTKHHEGFALHDSAVGDFDAGSALGRDLVREIVTALRAEGLRVGFYHSVIDWHHDQYGYALSEQLPHPLKGRPYPDGERDHARYVDYLHAQADELVSNYGPVDILWWDYSAQDFQGDEAWRATELMTKVRAKQPDIIMNNRLYRIPEAGWKSMGTDGFTASLDPRYGDFITPEQHIPDTGMPGVDWETCMTMNTTWGYSEHDHAWKSSETLIRNLVDIASKGGNYLLNIGPKGDGSVPEESVAAMQAIGAWMKVNRESIVGTTASPVASPAWGRVTVRETERGTTLYLHVFDWPADGKLTLEGVVRGVRRARLLAGGALHAEQRDGGIVISCPAAAPDPVDSVIALELAGSLARADR